MTMWQCMKGRILTINKRCFTTVFSTSHCRHWLYLHQNRFGCLVHFLGNRNDRTSSSRRSSCTYSHYCKQEGRKQRPGRRDGGGLIESCELHTLQRRNAQLLKQSKQKSSQQHIQLNIKALRSNPALSARLLEEMESLGFSSSN